MMIGNLLTLHGRGLASELEDAVGPMSSPVLFLLLHKNANPSHFMQLSLLLKIDQDDDDSCRL